MATLCIQIGKKQFKLNNFQIEEGVDVETYINKLSDEKLTELKVLLESGKDTLISEANNRLNSLPKSNIKKADDLKKHLEEQNKGKAIVIGAVESDVVDNLKDNKPAFETFYLYDRGNLKPIKLDSSANRGWKVRLVPKSDATSPEYIIEVEEIMKELQKYEKQKGKDWKFTAYSTNKELVNKYNGMQGGGGDVGLEDFTIYVGSKEEASKFADWVSNNSKLKSVIRKSKKPMSSEDLTSDQFNEYVHGRFDITNHEIIRYGKIGDKAATSIKKSFEASGIPVYDEEINGKSYYTVYKVKDKFIEVQSVKQGNNFKTNKILIGSSFDPKKGGVKEDFVIGEYNFKNHYKNEPGINAFYELLFGDFYTGSTKESQTQPQSFTNPFNTTEEFKQWYESDGTVIEPSDKIIWGHPGLGKTYLREQRSDILDFDSDYKPEVNKKYGLKEGNDVRNAWRKSNADLWNTEMRQLWIKAKQDAKSQNKILVVSDMIFLRENANDFDKIITTDKKTFVERSKQRGDYNNNTESWKNNIDTALSVIPKNKVITTDKYFSELFESNTTDAKYYEGNITPEPNTVFVFGRNPENRHGKGSASVAINQFGLNKGESKSDKAFGLITKDLMGYGKFDDSVLKVEPFGAVYYESDGARFWKDKIDYNGKRYYKIDDGTATTGKLTKGKYRKESQFTRPSEGAKWLHKLPTDFIQVKIAELYEEAKNNPNKEYKIAYNDPVTKRSYNGYTGLEMIDMFNNAGEIPSNIVFSKKWVDTGKLKIKSEPIPVDTTLQDQKQWFKDKIESTDKNSPVYVKKDASEGELKFARYIESLIAENEIVEDWVEEIVDREDDVEVSVANTFEELNSLVNKGASEIKLGKIEKKDTTIPVTSNSESKIFVDYKNGDFSEFPVIEGKESLNSEQEKAYNDILNFIKQPTETELIKDGDLNVNNMWFLSGAGGTGKTYTIGKIIKDSNIPFAFSAPSHNAKRELKSSLDGVVYADVNTIQSVLGIEIKDHRNKTFGLKYRYENTVFPIDSIRYLVIDEASMVGGELYDAMLKRFKEMGRMPKIIFLGDYAQIPPVSQNDKNFDSEIIRLLYHNNKDRTSILTENMRAKYQDIADKNLTLRDFIDRMNDILIYKTSKEKIKNVKKDFLEFLSQKEKTTNSELYNSLNSNEFWDNYIDLYKDIKDNFKEAVIVSYNNQDHNKTKEFISKIRYGLFGDKANDALIEGELLITNNNKLIPQKGKRDFEKDERFYVTKIEKYTKSPAFSYFVKGGRGKQDSFYYKGEVELITGLNEDGDTYSFLLPKKSLKQIMDDIHAGNLNDFGGNIPKINGDIHKSQMYVLIGQAFLDYDYGYVTTAHRVQGSTYNNVFVLEDNIASANTELKEVLQLLYTAYSRTKEKVHVLNNNQTILPESKSSDDSEIKREVKNDFSTNFQKVLAQKDNIKSVSVPFGYVNEAHFGLNPKKDGDFLDYLMNDNKKELDDFKKILTNYGYDYDSTREVWSKGTLTNSEENSPPFFEELTVANIGISKEDYEEYQQDQFSSDIIQEITEKILTSVDPKIANVVRNRLATTTLNRYDDNGFKQVVRGLNIEPSLKQKIIDNNILGFLLPGSNEIYLNATRIKNAGKSELDVLAHEILHNSLRIPALLKNDNEETVAFKKEMSAIVAELEKSSNLIISDLMNSLSKRNIEDKIDEVVVRALSDSDFVSALESMSATETDNSKSLWTKFVEAVQNFFGIKSNNYADRIIKTTIAYLDTQEADQEYFDPSFLEDPDKSANTQVKAAKNYTELAEKVYKEFSDRIIINGDYKLYEAYYSESITKKNNKSFQRHLMNVQQGDLILVPRWKKDGDTWVEKTDDNGKIMTVWVPALFNYSVSHNNIAYAKNFEDSKIGFVPKNKVLAIKKVYETNYEPASEDQINLGKQTINDYSESSKRSYISFKEKKDSTKELANTDYIKTPFYKGLKVDVGDIVTLDIKGTDTQFYAYVNKVLPSGYEVITKNGNIMIIKDYKIKFLTKNIVKLKTEAVDALKTFKEGDTVKLAGQAYNIVFNRKQLTEEEYIKFRKEKDDSNSEEELKKQYLLYKEKVKTKHLNTGDWVLVTDTYEGKEYSRWHPVITSAKDGVYVVAGSRTKDEFFAKKIKTESITRFAYSNKDVKETLDMFKTYEDKGYKGFDARAYIQYSSIGGNSEESNEFFKIKYLNNVKRGDVIERKWEGKTVRNVVHEVLPSGVVKVVVSKSVTPTKGSPRTEYYSIPVMPEEITTIQYLIENHPKEVEKARTSYTSFSNKLYSGKMYKKKDDKKWENSYFGYFPLTKEDVTDKYKQDGKIMYSTNKTLLYKVYNGDSIDWVDSDVKIGDVVKFKKNKNGTRSIISGLDREFDTVYLNNKDKTRKEKAKWGGKEQPIENLFPLKRGEVVGYYYKNKEGKREFNEQPVWNNITKTVKDKETGKFVEKEFVVMNVSTKTDNYFIDLDPDEITTVYKYRSGNFSDVSTMEDYDYNVDEEVESVNEEVVSEEFTSNVIDNELQISKGGKIFSTEEIKEILKSDTEESKEILELIKQNCK